MGHREGVKKRYGVGMWKNRGRGGREYRREDWGKKGEKKEERLGILIGFVKCNCYTHYIFPPLK